MWWCLLLSIVLLSGCNNVNNIPSNNTPVKNVSISNGKDNISKRIDKNNKKYNDNTAIFTTNKEEIKQRNKIISLINNLINKPYFVINDNDIKQIKKNYNNKNFLFLQLVLSINQIKLLLNKEKDILKNDKKNKNDQNQKLKNIWDWLYNGLSILNNNPLYKNNFINIKSSINNLIKRHYYTNWYFLLLDNEKVNKICNLLQSTNLDNKDNCLFILSKNYNIDLCKDIENKKIQDNCYIYKRQYLGYKQFKNIKRCLSNNNVKNRIWNIEGCFDYFYNKKYEKILKDLKHNKNLLNIINKKYRNIVILYFAKKYAEFLKDETICNKFYTKAQSRERKICKNDTIISIFKESDNIKWLNKIKNKTLQKYLILQYYPDIISSNPINKLSSKNNFCNKIKGTKEFQNCMDLLYFQKVRDTYESVNMTTEKYNEWDAICNKIQKANIRENCKRYIKTSYEINSTLNKWR